MKGERIANRTDFTVLEDTEDYIVVDKPAPMLVHPSKPSPVPTLWDELRALLAYDITNGAHLSIINRLDRETSGVVLITKHTEAARRFSIAMQRRRTEKIYQTLVHGWPSEDTFTINAPLLRRGEVEHSPIWLKRMVHKDGQSAVTRTRVLERIQHSGEQYSFLEVTPVTGRTHQIRVHLSHIGHPIVGDKIYQDETCYLRFIEDGWTSGLEKQLLFPRQALHASKLTFHFEEGDLSWAAPFPEGLKLSC